MSGRATGDAPPAALQPDALSGADTHVGVAIRIRGQVQGVGFRPFVWQLAQEMAITGEVLNDPEGVLIHAAGASLERFALAVRDRAPPLARVDAVEVSAHVFPGRPQGFAISASRGQGAETRVTPDAATCAECAAEIRDSTSRRFGYAFTNCTHCGPRFTILHRLPYDRAQTSMADFAMCPDCRAEYADPSDRRFHAQPIACPRCGPRLRLDGVDCADPLATAAMLLRSGKIVAVKGLGGFHLACDATDAAAIDRLRQRKQRPGKPFALMGTPEMVGRHARVSPAEAQMLADPAAPIVLLEKAAPLPDGLAPGQATLGWMLPYTPLHLLLLDAVGRPLVMTSGNVSGEPQVIGDAEARSKLGGFADALLLHDREIVRRLDDSVERVGPAGPMVLRRARGRVPGTLPLPAGFEDGPQILAYGGHMKAAVCLLKRGQAVLSHHLGDLDDPLTREEYDRALADYAGLFDHRPERAACDLHPGYASTGVAEASGLPLARVQHHHAHLASCLGENGWPLEGGRVAAVILDGLGLGDDGTIWGGEVLLGDYRGYERAAFLRPAALAGGDLASVEPWRNALVRLDQAGLAEEADRLFGARPLGVLRQAVRQGLNAPLSSSAGRLFDAVAAVLGICGARQSYEGEAGMLLEGLAEGDEVIEFGRTGKLIDPGPMLREIVARRRAGVPVGRLSAGFQGGLARAFCRAAREMVEEGQAGAVALSGGCFQNVALLGACLRELEGIRVLVHRQVPANDGGLAFGQALVAAARAG